jgi:hypothetical protein
VRRDGPLGLIACNIKAPPVHAGGHSFFEMALSDSGSAVFLAVETRIRAMHRLSLSSSSIFHSSTEERRSFFWPSARSQPKWSIPAHTEAGRQAKAWLVLSCVLDWRDRDDQVDWRVQTTRRLLADLVGGEPGRTCATSSPPDLPRRLKPAGSRWRAPTLEASDLLPPDSRLPQPAIYVGDRGTWEEAHQSHAPSFEQSELSA